MYDFADSRPTFKDLAVLPSLKTDWFNVGMYLNVDIETLNHIRQGSTKMVKKQREMFKAYIAKTPNPSWKQLIKALQHCRKDDIAHKVCETFQLSADILSHSTSDSESTEKWDLGDKRSQEIDKQHVFTPAPGKLPASRSKLCHNEVQPDFKVHNLKQNIDDVDAYSRLDSATLSSKNKQPNFVQADSDDHQYQHSSVSIQQVKRKMAASTTKSLVPATHTNVEPPFVKHVLPEHYPIKCDINHPSTEHQNPVHHRSGSSSDYQSFSDSGEGSNGEIFHDVTQSFNQPKCRVDVNGQPPNTNECSKYTSLDLTIQRSRLSTSNRSGERERNKHFKHATAPAIENELLNVGTLLDRKRNVSIL